MDPFTIAAGIGAMGSLFKGVTSLFGGNNQARAFQNAAQQADQEAGVNAQIGLQEGNAAAASGAVRAAAGGGGFTGSAMGVLSNMLQDAMFNARNAVYRGQTEAQRDLYQGAVAKAQGVQGAISGAVDAASTMAGGFMRSSMFAKQMSAMSSLRGDPYATMQVGY